jgi:lipopolysaccharide export system protein LptA
MTKRLLILPAMLLALAAGAHAQDSGGQSPAGDQPVKTDIVADQMEIISEDKKAVFTGKVELKRGDVTWNADTMTIAYDEIKQPDGSSKSEVKTVESKGSVKIVTKTQTITGEWAKMDVKANKLQVGGNVKVVTGKSVLTGELLNSDLTANKSEFSGGRVKGSFLPN